MIGLGVGIDYALFIVTRYREALTPDPRVEDSVAESIDTSGRAVLFAGTTVIIALLGLSLMGLEFVTGVAIASAVGVLLMVIASLTLLPALLGWVGARIDNTTRAALIAGRPSLVVDDLRRRRLLGARRHAASAVRAGDRCSSSPASLFKGASCASSSPTAPRSPPSSASGTAGAASSSTARGRTSSSASCILLCCSPSRCSRSASASATTATTHEDQTVRRAYDLLAEGFGPGTNGPLLRHRPGRHRIVDPSSAQAVRRRRCNRPIPASPSPPCRRRRPTTSRSSSCTRRRRRRTRPRPTLVHDLAFDIPSITADTGVDAKVGGLTAGSSDFAAYLAGRMPLLIGVVLLLSFILLMAVFRSLARAAQGGGHEPAVDRRGLRHARRHLPVGLGHGLDRRRQGGTDRGLGPDVPVRHRVRPVDGLRGVPPLADQGGVRPHGARGHPTTAPPSPTAWRSPPG